MDHNGAAELEWWNVGIPPEITRWCEGNVEKASEALVSELTPWLEMKDEKPVISLYSGLWECQLDQWTGPLWFENVIKRAVDQGDYPMLEAIKDQIDAALIGRNGQR